MLKAWKLWKIHVECLEVSIKKVIIKNDNRRERADHDASLYVIDEEPRLAVDAVADLVCEMLAAAHAARRHLVAYLR